MRPSLNDALHLVRLHLGDNWYAEPADHKADGFYRAKVFLRGILGGLVIIHDNKDSIYSNGEILAFIDGEMHRADIG